MHRNPNNDCASAKQALEDAADAAPSGRVDDRTREQIDKITDCYLLEDLASLFCHWRSAEQMKLDAGYAREEAEAAEAQKEILARIQAESRDVLKQIGTKLGAEYGGQVIGDSPHPGIEDVDIAVNSFEKFYPDQTRSIPGLISIWKKAATYITTPDAEPTKDSNPNAGHPKPYGIRDNFATARSLAQISALSPEAHDTPEDTDELNQIQDLEKNLEQEQQSLKGSEAAAIRESHELINYPISWAIDTSGTVIFGTAKFGTEGLLEISGEEASFKSEAGGLFFMGDDARGRAFTHEQAISEIQECMAGGAHAHVLVHHPDTDQTEWLWNSAAPQWQRLPQRQWADHHLYNSPTPLQSDPPAFAIDGRQIIQRYLTLLRSEGTDKKTLAQLAEDYERKTDLELKLQQHRKAMAEQRNAEANQSLGDLLNVVQTELTVTETEKPTLPPRGYGIKTLSSPKFGGLNAGSRGETTIPPTPKTGPMDVDVYIWNSHVWSYEAVGHVMVTEADSHTVLLSQFPNKGTIASSDRQLSFDETFAREGLPPSLKFRVRLGDAKTFYAAIMDIPVDNDQTQCTLAVYIAIRAGGVNFSEFMQNTNVWSSPEVFGKALESLSSHSNSGVRNIMYSH
jgi:hypothetical protein